jgi:hypothetical protein
LTFGWTTCRCSKQEFIPRCRILPVSFWGRGGNVEAINRLLLGFSPLFEEIMRIAKVEEEKIDHVMDLAFQYLPATLISPSMPIQDAIDLAEYLVPESVTSFSIKGRGLN